MAPNRPSVLPSSEPKLATSEAPSLAVSAYSLYVRWPFTATVCSGVKPASMPLEPGVRIRPSAWNETRPRARWFRSVTTTQSPAATWSTSGSGFARPRVTDWATPDGTNAERTALLKALDFTSTALTRNVLVGAPAGHGLPGSPSAGRSPVTACGVAGVAGAG